MISALRPILQYHHHTVETKSEMKHGDKYLEEDAMVVEMVLRWTYNL
jgi:hypothetical protein